MPALFHLTLTEKIKQNQSISYLCLYHNVILSNLSYALHSFFLFIWN